MEKEILDIINEYQHMDKDIDIDFIMRIITLARKYYNLKHYVENTEIRYDTNMPQAQYNVIAKEIYVNPEFINKVLFSLNDEFKNLKYNKLFRYLYTSKILLHEIEHANQHKKIREQNDIESEILRAEYSVSYDIMQNSTLVKIPKLIYQNKLRKKYYDFSPSERLAEHIACEHIEKIANEIQDETSCNLIQHFKYWNILRGYNVGVINNLSNSPTKTYLEKINPSYDYSIIANLEKDISQYDKIKFGLEADKKELNKTAYKWQLVYNKIKKN